MRRLKYIGNKSGMIENQNWIDENKVTDVLSQCIPLTLIFIYCIVKKLITRHLFEHSDKMNRLRNNLVENIYSTQGKNAKRKKQTFRQ